MSDLRALTLWPEWAWAVCHLDKRVENRPERVARMLARHDGLLAIHAGKHLGGRPGRTSAWEGIWALMRTAEKLSGQNVDELWSGGDGEDPDRWRFRFRHGGGYADLRLARCPTSAIVAVCRTGALLPPGAGRPWQAPGSWAVELVDVQVLATPIPCRGAQGLWSVGDEVEAAVLREVNRG